MMTKMQPGIWIVFIVLLAGSTSHGADGGVAAITRPSGDVTLSFVRRGQIAKVLVKEGQTVKVAQALIQQDDTAEQANLAQMKAQADDTIRIKAAQAQLDQKKVDLKRIEWAAKRGASTELEVEHAKLDVLIAELSLKLAKFEHTQDKRKYDEAKIHISRMRLKSPVSGRVERIFMEAGESVDELEDVIRIVNVDPLWIDVPVPLKKARTLNTGQKAVVDFTTADDAGKEGRTTGGETADGKIVHIASVADAASNTLTVRVEVPNSTNRPAGEHVRVKFTPSAKGTGSGKTSSKSSATTNSEKGSSYQWQKTLHHHLRMNATKNPSKNRRVSKPANGRFVFAWMSGTCGRRTPTPSALTAQPRR